MEKDIFKGKSNIFLTGNAGTGKSYQLNRYIEENPNTIVTAPTGIAAVNIGGVTMHKAFGIPLPAYGYKTSDIKNDIVKTIAKADSIIIDELPMCRNDVFSFAIKVIKKAEKLKGSKIRLILSGDFSQLPPVVTKSEYKDLIKYGFDASGFVFTTKEWKSLKLKPIVLDKIMRQTDKEFIEALARVRKGDKDILPYFNQFVNTDTSAYKDYIRICGTNAEVDLINTTYLDSLKGSLMAYPIRKSGRTPKDMFDEVFCIKEGAEVIFTANDIIHNEYNNGTMGYVEKCHPNYITVNIDGKSKDIYYRECPIYDIDTKSTTISKKQVGTVWHMPMKLGRAMTIHKSQGQTFEKAVITPDIFAPGQLYVALSRVKSPEGLILTKEIPENALKCEPLVELFYENNFGYVEPLTASEVKSKKTKKTTKKATTTKKKSDKATVTKKKANTKTVKSSSSKTKSSSTKKTPTKKTTVSKPKKTIKTSATKTKKSDTKTKKVDTKVKKTVGKTTKNKDNGKNNASKSKESASKKKTSTKKK